MAAKTFPKMIDFPFGMTEEPVVIREVAMADGTAGDDQISNIAMPYGNDPAAHE